MRDGRKIQSPLLPPARPFSPFSFFICLFCGVGDGDGDGAKICLHEIEPWEARPIHPQALPSQSPLLESCGWPLQINWDRSGSERVAGGAGILPLAQSQPPRPGERELLSGTCSAIRSKADGTGHIRRAIRKIVSTEQTPHLEKYCSTITYIHCTMKPVRLMPHAHAITWAGIRVRRGLVWHA